MCARLVTVSRQLFGRRLNDAVGAMLRKGLQEHAFGYLREGGDSGGSGRVACRLLTGRTCAPRASCVTYAPRWPFGRRQAYYPAALIVAMSICSITRVEARVSFCG